MEFQIGTLILIITFVGVISIIGYNIYHTEKDRRYYHCYNRPYLYKIKQKVDLLHRELPNKPTSIDGIYTLPKYLKGEILKSNFSQTSIQKVADNIAEFLGIVSSVKVKTGIESSEDMLASKSQLNNADQVGLYTVKGTFNREIQITKRYRFNINHILAILAHESVHNYLYHYHITENNERENEILTDVACAYLGLGELLVKGYKPIKWKTKGEPVFDKYEIKSTYILHELRIGYLDIENIKYAITLSSIKRNLIDLVPPSRYFCRMHVYKYFKKKGGKKKKINDLLNKISLLENLYNNCLKLYERHLLNINNIQIDLKDSKIMVEMANSFSIGNIKLDINSLISNLNSMKNYETDGRDRFSEVSKKSESLKKKLSNWINVLKKYII